MHTVAEHMELIGKQGVWHHEGLDINVTVLNAKYNYGRLLLKITPSAGTGYKWVAEQTVSFGNGQ